MESTITLQRAAFFALKGRTDSKGDVSKELAYAEMEIMALRSLLRYAGINPYTGPRPPDDGAEIPVTHLTSKAEEFTVG